MSGLAGRLARSPHPLICAHRGLWGPHPENSLSALRAAAEAGADVVELDARLASDGNPVVIHDDTTRRTTGKDHLVSESSSADLTALRLLPGAGGGGTPTEECLPSLSQFLENLPDGLLLDIDVKEQEEVPEIANIVGANPLASRTYIKRDLLSAEDVDHINSLAASTGVTMVPRVLFLDAREARRLAPLLLGVKAPMAEVVFYRLEDYLIFCEALGDTSMAHATLTLDEVHADDLNDTRALNDPDAVWGTYRNLGVRHMMTDRVSALHAWRMALPSGS